MPDNSVYDGKGKEHLCGKKDGGAGGIRTPYLLLAKQAFSRLNYGPATLKIIAYLRLFGVMLYGLPPKLSPNYRRPVPLISPPSLSGTGIVAILVMLSFKAG
jgi:hypothetical protein